MVGYHSRTSDSAFAPGLALAPPVAFEERTAKFDLVFNFTEYLDDDRVELRLEYGSDLFDRATAEKIARRQVVVLDASRRTRVARSATSTCSSATNANSWCAGSTTPHSRWRRRRSTRHSPATWPRPPRTRAVVDGDGEVTYAELSVRADRIAALLHRRGVCAEDVVGLAVPRSAQMVSVVLGGVLKLGGAAYLPLDLNHPSDRISYMLADSAARVLVTTVGGRARASRTSAASLAFSSTTRPSSRNSRPAPPPPRRCRSPPRRAWTRRVRHLHVGLHR